MPDHRLLQFPNTSCTFTAKRLAITQSAMMSQCHRFVLRGVTYPLYQKGQVLAQRAVGNDEHSGFNGFKTIDHHTCVDRKEVQSKLCAHVGTILPRSHLLEGGLSESYASGTAFHFYSNQCGDFPVQSGHSQPYASKEKFCFTDYPTCFCADWLLSPVEMHL